jgi:hypothetical protein
MTVTTPATPRRDVRDEPVHPGRADDEEFVREDEFQCTRCGMFVPRARLGDPWLRLCQPCATYVSLAETPDR